ncbi:MAG: YciI family protein [Gammaproteobacteria bacterium]
MPYIALCDDDPTVDAAGLRQQEKTAHFAYIESILDKLLVAGPLTDVATGKHQASLFVYATDDEDEARALLENDPYFRAGIYARVRITAFTPAAGEWLGGKIW